MSKRKCIRCGDPLSVENEKVCSTCNQIVMEKRIYDELVYGSNYQMPELSQENVGRITWDKGKDPFASIA